MIDAARSLAHRLRAENIDPADIELAARVVLQRGIPRGELVRIRDSSYRGYRDGSYSHLKSIRAQARHVHQDLLRYFTTAWRQDQHHIFLPYWLYGKPRAFLWEALKHGNIPSVESLRKILR